MMTMPKARQEFKQIDQNIALGAVDFALRVSSDRWITASNPSALLAARQCAQLSPTARLTDKAPGLT